MATFFDVGSLTREELELISQRVYKKTATLDRNYVTNKDHLMKFIESIAKKSENRDSFWNRLSRRLDQLPTPAAPNTLMPSSSGSRDTEIFAFFQGNLARLQGLLANLIAKGSQRVIIGKLTDALSITQRSSHVSSLNEAQMSLLRDLHSSINARREATATANLNNSANYNGSSVGSSGSIAGSNNSRQRPASNQNCGPQYNQNIVPNGPAYNQNSLQGSSAYSQNIMSKSSTFNQNSSSSGPSYNQNSAPLGSTHNQNGALRGQPYIQNDIPRDQFYNQNTCVPSGPMYNPNSAPNGSMHNHNGTSRGLNGNLTNGSEYQNNPQINSAFSQNAHSNAPNGATYNHSNTSNSTTYSQNNASNCTAYHQYAAPSGPRYIQNSLPSDLSYNQQSIHSNALTYSHNGAPSDGMYSRNNAPIAVHNQNNALINISYDQSSTLNNPTYIQTSALLPSQEPTTQAQAQAQIVQIQIDRLSSETAWVKDFYDKVHSVLQVVVSLSARVLSFSDSLLLESMQGIISKIETEDMTNRDSQVIIGDSALTGNALYGLKVIMNRCKLALEPLMVKTVSTDISCSVNIASEKLFPCLSLLEAALNSLCLGKYAVTSKDNIASVESRKRKASFLNVQLYLGANSQKRKLQPGSVSLR